jgi:hypothetical protein
VIAFGLGADAFAAPEFFARRMNGAKMLSASSAASVNSVIKWNGATARTFAIARKQQRLAWDRV